MTLDGRKALPDMRLESFEVNIDIEKRLKEDNQTFENYMSFPELYRRIRVDNIQREKNNSEVYLKRLNKFIENTRLNKIYGSWNDNGRLLE